MRLASTLAVPKASWTTSWPGCVVKPRQVAMIPSFTPIDLL
jgi:hypothetical protein